MKRSQMWTSAAAAAATMVLAIPASWAGGLARPNPVSARAIGMGGAFSAVADDPTALHFNPAGLAYIPTSNLLIGGEFVVAPRTYTPRFDDGRCEAANPPPQCQVQSPTSPVRPLPSLGFSTRLERDGVPSRLTFGIGLWNTFGGQLEFKDKEDIPGTLRSTRNAVIEIVPGLAYEVNDVLAVGVSFRLGVGLFDIESIARPSNAVISAIGVGAGATLGLMLRPNDKLSIGTYYRTPLNVTTSGSAEIDSDLDGTTDISTDAEFIQKWPDQAGIGVAYKPTSALLVSAQFDWTGWGRVNDITPVFANQQDLTRQASIDADWDDSMAIHIGGQYAISHKIQVRGGFTYDTKAVIDRTQERQFLDSKKQLFALGGSYRVTSKWRIDTAFEVGPGGTLTIDDNSQEAGDAQWAARSNVSPGDHGGKLFTFELAGQYLF